MAGPEKIRLDHDDFLARYWQREPLLIRDALPDFRPPITADELAGLALEPEVESRIVEHKDGQWQQHHGPFEDADFHRDAPWTLLVQAVDHYHMETALLRRMVDFIPQWRVDDVMVSYAVDGGSVGPHYDNYDVFLLQGEGQRLWRLGQHCDAASTLLPHDDLRILERFDERAEYLLGPGDILYIPPGIAHWGIAQGECTTFSIGFRAPRVNDLLSRFTDSALTALDADLFYTDAELHTARRPGEIRPEDLARAKEQALAALGESADESWLGELVTEPRYAIAPGDEDLAESRALLREPGESATLSPDSKLAWQLSGDQILVFANGECRSFAAELVNVVEALCSNWQLPPRDLAVTMEQNEGAALLDYLLETGCIYVQ